MRKTKIGVYLISLLAVYYVYHNFFFKTTIYGKYVNRNVDIGPAIPDVANSEDTLVIYPNNRFVSPFFGKGTYSIEYGIDGTSIDLKYGQGFSSGVISTHIERMYFSSPKIVIDRDLAKYYEKVD